jgi:DNA processing protein
LISPYGLQVTPEIVCPLAQHGLTIVSGLAIGVDALAHLSALKAHGRTIAVLGTGVDARSLYPTQNRRLAEQIIEQGGAVISEFSIGTPPLKQNFPIRNRIISGLSLGTLVIEAARESGSLITARSALEQNREVFAVPGSAHSPTSAGPNNLLKMGARVVTSATDILDALNIEPRQEIIGKRKITADNLEEAALLPHLSREPRYIDALVKASHLGAPQVMSILTIMEIKGKVRNLGGMQYVLA